MGSNSRIVKEFRATNRPSCVFHDNLARDGFRAKKIIPDVRCPWSVVIVRCHTHDEILRETQVSRSPWSFVRCQLSVVHVHCPFAFILVHPTSVVGCQ